MVDESRRGGPERARFVMRARTLKDDRSFQAYCRETVADWNSVFPEFKIADRTLPPDEHALSPEDFFFPPVLLQPRPRVVIYPFDPRKLRDQFATPVKAKDIEPPNRLRVVQAKQSWRNLVIGLCERYWPETDFPHRLNCQEHPAHHFAAACLIYRPMLVPEEWILQPQVIVRLAAHHSDDTTEVDIPNDAQGRLPHETMLDLIKEIIAENGALLAKDLPVIKAAAERAVDEARAADKSALPTPVLLGYPGISTEEMRKAAPLINDYFRGQFDVRERALQLKAEGMLNAEIARRLGVDRATVIKWHKNATRDSGCGSRAGKSQRSTA